MTGMRLGRLTRRFEESHGRHLASILESNGINLSDDQKENIVVGGRRGNSRPLRFGGHYDCRN